MSFNRVQIFGYLGRDPELKYTPDGTAVCKLSVATTEKRKGRNGEQEDMTTWFRCTAWRKTGELINEYFSKGSPIFIEGKMHVEEYKDRDGVPRYSVEVNVSSFEFAGKAPGASDGAKAKAGESEEEEASGDDIPF